MSEQYTRKSHTGEAGNKGEFGTHTRSDADVSLGGPVALPPMERDVEIGWTEAGISADWNQSTTQVRKTGVHTVSVRTVAAGEAPVAFSASSIRSDGGVVNYRVVDGQLYADADGYRGEPWSSADLLIDDWAQDARSDSMTSRAKADVTGSIDARAAGIIVIDGATWAKAAEPVYAVSTYGYGQNEGGTTLTTQRAPDTSTRQAGRRYFRADQHDEAVAFAVQLATERGDTESVETLQQHTPHRSDRRFHPGVDMDAEADD